MENQEIQKVNIDQVKATLTFGEIDSLERMTKMGLGELQVKRQGLLAQAVMVIGNRRMGNDISLSDLEGLVAEDYIMSDDDDEEPGPDPTEASS